MSAQLESFEQFCGLLRIESGAPFVLEPWQREVTADLLSGTRELVLTLPKANGKTTLEAAQALHHLLITSDARVYVAAASKEQAGLLFDYARGFVARSPELAAAFSVKPGFKEIRSCRDLGFIRVISADADTSDGTGATLAIADELHRWRTLDLYDTLRDGLGKRGGQLVVISTPGDDEASPLGRLRARALEMGASREGSHVTVRTPAFAFHEWSVPDGEDVNDLAVVKRANPSSFVTIDSLRERRDSPSMRASVWERFACGRWVEQREEVWITAEAWDRCAAPDREIRRGEQCVLALDGSYNGDTTALMGCTVPRAGETPHLFVAELWEVAENAEGATIPVLEVEHTITEICRVLKVREIAADPFRWQRSLEVLAAQLLPVVVFPQSPSRMVPATAALFEALHNAQVTHDGDDRLRRHVLSAVTRDRGHGVTISKESRRSRRRIDLAAAAIMSFERATHYRKSAAATCYAGADILFGVSDLPLEELRAADERERAAEDFELAEARRTVEELRALVGEGAS